MKTQPWCMQPGHANSAMAHAAWACKLINGACSMGLFNRQPGMHDLLSTGIGAIMCLFLQVRFTLDDGVPLRQLSCRSCSRDHTMQNFAAIDFETANSKRSSVCSVGVVICRNGSIVEEIYEMIRPVPDYFSQACINVHGIRPRDVATADPFPAVWSRIEPRISGLPLVAHNRAFDRSCLQNVFEAYDMIYPDYEFHCTLLAARRLHPELPNHRLNTLSRIYNIDLQHHQALSDARACASLALQIL